MPDHRLRAVVRRRTLATLTVSILISFVMSPSAAAAASEMETSDEVIAIPEVMVQERRPSESASQGSISETEIAMQPPGRPGNLLRQVPGLITFNPTGGPGKADNFLLRGFDADHGTDLAGFLDGMPLNLRSHAHGQGYLDLNFLIPETLRQVDFYKGPYQVQFGDFATAGAVNFRTRDVVEEGVVQAVGGQFDTQRNLLMFSPTRDRIRTLVAAETYYTNGFYDDPNRALRLNGLAKATMNPTGRTEISVMGTYYQSRWNATGEIPLRAVESGLIDRFGSLDPSQGGTTQRTTASVRAHYETPLGGTAFAGAAIQYYQLALFSNFTFFLTDPIHGDGIEQNDRRYVYTGQVGYRHPGALGSMTGSATMGIQGRFDQARVRVGTQQDRVPLAITSDSQILESSYSPFLELDVHLTPWARLVGGPRVDVFAFSVQDECPTTCAVHPAGHKQASILTNKGNLILGPWWGTELFLNAGSGFHSNDARAVVSSSAIQPLPRASAYEVGLRTRQWNRVEFLVALWQLDLTSELVFAGDTGTTNILGATHRQGVELGNRINLTDWLTFTGDLTFTHAVFRGTDAAIPRAPLTTGRAELLARLSAGLTTSLQLLHLGRRYLTEDRSVTGEGFTIVNLVARYHPARTGQWRHLEAFLSIQNLFNTPWRQDQLFFESRLANEPAPVGDIHFQAGNPRFVLGGLSWYF